MDKKRKTSIRELMKKTGIKSVAELSRRTGISRAGLYRAMDGCPVTQAFLVKLAIGTNQLLGEITEWRTYAKEHNQGVGARY